MYYIFTDKPQSDETRNYSYFMPFFCMVMELLKKALPMLIRYDLSQNILKMDGFFLHTSEWLNESC